MVEVRGAPATSLETTGYLEKSLETSLEPTDVEAHQSLTQPTNRTIVSPASTSARGMLARTLRR